MRPTSYSFLLVLIIAGTAGAQLPSIDPKTTAEAKEMRAQIVEQVSADVQGLRLAENRAYALVRSGSLLCRDDKKAATSFFQRGVNELISAMLTAEAEEKARPTTAAMQLSRIVRPTIITMIGTCDPELALESLLRSRTPSTLRDLAAPPEEAGKITDRNAGPSQTVQSELTLEQRLMRIAAQQNPEIAAKLIQDSIKKGLSSETLALLKQLYVKDPEAAVSLAKESMDRLLGASFSADAEDRNEVTLAGVILADHLRPVRAGAKELRFDDAQVRSLANKYISFTIAQDRRSPMAGNLAQTIRIAERWSPASVTTLRRLQQERRAAGAGPRLGNEAQRLISSNASASQMVASANRLPADDRRQVMQSAAEKMAGTGDYDGAMAMLNQNFSGRALDNAISSLNRRYAETLVNQGRWQEAENLIDQLPETNRRIGLIELAKKAHAKDPEANRALASNALRKARMLLPDRPFDHESTLGFAQLSLAYAPIEAEEAFRLMEAVVPVLNDLADANAFVSAFRSEMLVRQGEYTLFPSPVFGFQLDPAIWRALQRTDAERTYRLIDGFVRRELRISIRFQLATADTPPPPMPVAR